VVAERLTVCGEFAAASVAARLAVAAPLAVGLKAICKVQLAPAAKDVEQVLLVISNSAALEPAKVKDFTERATAPGLVKVMVCDAESAPTAVDAKERLLGESVAFETGAEAVRVTVCGELAALSVATRPPETVPVVVGAKAICKVQLAPAAKAVEHVFAVISKALLPWNVKLFTEMADVLVLVKVTVCEADLDPTAVAGKVRLLGEN
jgi:hypothetical protein